MLSEEIAKNGFLVQLVAHHALKAYFFGATYELDLIKKHTGQLD